MATRSGSITILTSLNAEFTRTLPRVKAPETSLSAKRSTNYISAGRD